MTYQRSMAGQPKAKRMISFLIREQPDDPHHHNGVNALQYDFTDNRLFSAGRDGVIRVWKINENTSRVSTHLHAMEHHTDWVNDIVLCCNGRNVVSASSDCTVKVWNSNRGFCMSTLRTHKDYVKCLAYAKDKEQVVSGGFDRQIFLWDVRRLLQLTANNNTINTQNLVGSRESIYSLAMNSSGTVCIAGSSENVLRVWDTRASDLHPIFKLKGHSDNIKSVKVSDDATSAVSGSSDGTIRLWSLGEQRCIDTYRAGHDDSVWSLLVDPHFTTVYSGGRDRRLFQSSLKAPSADGQFSLVAEESHPILSMQFGDVHRSSIWVGTTASHIKKWQIPKPQQDGPPGVEPSEQGDDRPVSRRSLDAPIHTIEGKPAIVQYHILNNKRHILTRDVNGIVAKWDVLLACKSEVLGAVDFDEEVKNNFQLIYVPTWFSVDVKTGELCIHLEDSDCVQSWVSTKDVPDLRRRVVDEDLPEPEKVNYGTLLLQALLEKWPPACEPLKITDPDTGDVVRRIQLVGNNYFSVPPFTTFIVSEVQTAKSVGRFQVRNCDGETEAAQLNEFLPSWVFGLVVLRNLPKFHKLPFFLVAHPNCTLKVFNGKKDRLSANDLLPVRKVLEHVWEKMLHPVEHSDGGGSSTTAGGGAMSQEELNAGVEKLELLCNDTVLGLNMDLRTIKHFVWRGNSGDLNLMFKQRSNPR